MDRSTPILVFDGHCALCRRAVDFLERHRRVTSTMHVVAYHRLAATSWRGVLSDEEAARAVWWVEGATRHEGGRAVARVLRELRGPWSVIGRLLDAPLVSRATARAYRCVARRRPCDVHDRHGAAP